MCDLPVNPLTGGARIKIVRLGGSLNDVSGEEYEGFDYLYDTKSEYLFAVGRSGHIAEPR